MMAGPTMRLVLLTMALLLVRVAHAATVQHWTAVSQTAMAITGDIDLSASRIVFQNRASLQLSYVGNARGVTWVGDARDQLVRVYRIVHPSNMKLLNGNALCGSHDLPAYLTVFQRAAPPAGAGAASDVFLHLTVITGSGEVNLRNYASRICAGYTYASAGPPSATVTLENAVWNLVELGGSPLTTRQTQIHPRFRLDASTRRVEGFAGCNQIVGEYRVEAGQLSFLRVATTRRYCQEGIMEMESAFLKALGATTRYRITLHRLELYRDERLLAAFQNTL